jgi:hypothetical protein
MNTRIKELAKCNERIQNFFETGPVQRAALEEFAELVVQDCVDLLEFHGFDDAVSYVKLHFGVEE